MAKHDQKIKELLNKVEEQKANLGTKPKSTWNTNGIFKYKDGTFFNLNATRDPNVLIEALATLLERNNLLIEASQQLEVKPPTLLWDGYTLTEWKLDFKKRLDILQWEEKKTQLDATQKKLNELVSEEARTEMELATIEDLLK